MGDWAIVIRGVGAHHGRGNASDANRMAAEFVQKLRAIGHNVVSASMTFGGAEDLSMPKRYLDDRNAIEGIPQAPRCEHPVGDEACRLVQKHEGDHEPPIKWQQVGTQ